MLSRLANAAKYILATAGLTVISLVILHSWFAREQAPSVVLVVALLVFALLPIADRIKVFDWIDFRKSISDIETEIGKANSRVDVLSTSMQKLDSRISSSMTSIQDHKQIINNFSVSSEIAAFELASQLSAHRAQQSEKALRETPESDLDIRLTQLVELQGLMSELTAALRILKIYSQAEELDHYISPEIDFLKETGSATLPDILDYFQSRGGRIIDRVASERNVLKFSEKFSEVAEIMVEIETFKNSGEHMNPEDFEKVVGVAATNLGYFQGFSFVLTNLSAQFFLPAIASAPFDEEPTADHRAPSDS